MKNYQVYFRNIRENIGIYDIHEQILFDLKEFIYVPGCYEYLSVLPKIAHSLPQCKLRCQNPIFVPFNNLDFFHFCMQNYEIKEILFIKSIYIYKINTQLKLKPKHRFCLNSNRNVVHGYVIFFLFINYYYFFFFLLIFINQTTWQ